MYEKAARYYRTSLELIGDSWSSAEKRAGKIPKSYGKEISSDFLFGYLG